MACLYSGSGHRSDIYIFAHVCVCITFTFIHTYILNQQNIQITYFNKISQLKIIYNYLYTYSLSKIKRIAECNNLTIVTADAKWQGNTINITVDTPVFSLLQNTYVMFVI